MHNKIYFIVCILNKYFVYFVQGWLAKNRDHHAPQQAYCRVCRKSLRAHHTDLQAHCTREAHVKRSESVDVKKQATITSTFSTQKDKGNEKKERDLKLAAYIACHSAIRSVNHLCDVLKNLEFQLRETKCANLIKNVIAPNMLRDLIQDVGDGPYSLIIDESTDVSSCKFLCLCIKYFSKMQNRIITDYLGIIRVDKADSVTLHSAIITYCKDINLKIKNLVGLGTDGGSNLCAKKHSVFALLKADNHKLQLIRCICHSLNNAVSAASSHFPANVEFLCREVYSWFSHSPLRQSEYKKTWDLLNTGYNLDDDNDNGNDGGEEAAAQTTSENDCNENKNKTFRKFVKLSTTRWLARYNVVKVLLENYKTLQSHFNIFVQTNTEKCYTARLLCTMLNDDTNYLYLVIVKPILGELNYANASFQRSNVDLGRAYGDLSSLIMLLAGKILKPTFMTGDLETILKHLDNPLHYLSVDNANYGIDYKNAVKKSNITPDQKFDVETRAFNFIKALCLEISSRLPDNLTFYKKLKFLSPSICLSQTQRPQLEELPFLEIFASTDLGALETQWNRLLTIDWASYFGKDILKNSYTFWPMVYNFKNAGGKSIFQELASYALTLLVLPSSNAVVERVFSIMNVIKNKFRNQMLIKMLDSLLRIRLRFYANYTCCNTFEPTPAMLADFNYKIVYPISEKENVLQLEQEEMEIIGLLESYEIPCISILER